MSDPTEAPDPLTPADAECEHRLATPCASREDRGWCVVHGSALRAATPDPAEPGLREAAQDLMDFHDGGGFRANHPYDHFDRLRAVLARSEEPT